MPVSFKHSGNTGDVIYSLAGVQHYVNSIDDVANIFLHLNVKAEYAGPGNSHPVGDVMINEKMYELVKPLLLEQPYIDEVFKHTSQTVKFNLDRFRVVPMNLAAGNIARWNFLAYPQLTCDLAKKWIHVEPAENDYIIVNRSARYRNLKINYSFLTGKAVRFVGVDSEYYDFVRIVPDAVHLKVDDFLQMAQLIAGCRFFIGNQSMAFAIAEGLKVPRALELCPYAPNVIPAGEHAYDFIGQEMFEDIVKTLEKETVKTVAV